MSNLNNRIDEPPKRFSKEYVHHDFSALNAFIDGLIKRDAAEIEQRILLVREKKLRLIILMMIVIILVSFCLTLWLFNTKLSLLTVTTAPNNSGNNEEAVIELAGDIEETIEKSGLLSINQKTIAGDETVVTNFTIFKKQTPPSGKYKNISSITTGYNYISSETMRPSSQYCYADTNIKLGNSTIDVSLANFENGILIPKKISEKELIELNILRRDFEELLNYCDFIE